jgi:hypothetical protein
MAKTSSALAFAGISSSNNAVRFVSCVPRPISISPLKIERVSSCSFSLNFAKVASAWRSSDL